MRSTMIALVLAAGFGVAYASPSLSAPATGSGLGQLSILGKSDAVVEKAHWRRWCRHWRHSRRTCWRRWW